MVRVQCGNGFGIVFVILLVVFLDLEDAVCLVLAMGGVGVIQDR